jgi:hypothetical protein
LKKAAPLSARDFFHDESKALCVCPAGHKLYQSGTNMLFNGLVRQSGVHSRAKYVGDSGNGVEWSSIAIILGRRDRRDWTNSRR